MNSPTKISPDTQLLLDELRKLSRKFEQFTVEVASRGVPVPTQSVPIVGADNWGGLFDGDVSVPTQVVAADVIADNWGGLFSGGDVSDEPHGEEHSIVADNWDGLFEQSAHVLEVRDIASTNQIRIESCLASTVSIAAFPVDISVDFDSTDPIATLDAGQKLIQYGLIDIEYISAADSSAPFSTCSKLTAEEFVSGMGGDANRNGLTSNVPDGLLHASQGRAMEIKPEEYPHPSQEELEEERQDANIATLEAALSKHEVKMRALAGPPRLHVSPFAPDSELQCATGMYSSRLMAPLADPNAPRGGDEPVFVGADMQRNHNGFAPNDPDLLRCVRLTIHLGPVERVLSATLLGDYDGSLDDDPDYGAAHLDAPLDRAFGRVGLTLAAAAALREDAIGAAGGGLMAGVVAAGSALTFAEAASNDAAASTTTCSTDCSAGSHSFLYDTCNNLSRSTLGPAIVVFQDVAEHNQPRYFTANPDHTYSVDGAVVRLYSASIAAHAVQKVFGEIFAQNLVQLRQPWPPPIEFACFGNGVNLSLLCGFTQDVTVPKPPWLPPQSNELPPWLHDCWLVICEAYGVIKGVQQVTSSGLSCASIFSVKLQLHISRPIVQSVVFCEELLKDNSAIFQCHKCRESVLWLQLPACVCSAVSNMKLLHDGASICLALVTESAWFILFGKAAVHELLDCNTMILVCYTVCLIFDPGKIRKGVIKLAILLQWASRQEDISDCWLPFLPFILQIELKPLSNWHAHQSDPHYSCMELVVCVTLNCFSCFSNIMIPEMQSVSYMVLTLYIFRAMILGIDDEKETVQTAVSELQLALKATEVKIDVVRMGDPTFRLLTEAEIIRHLKAINPSKAELKALLHGTLTSVLVLDTYLATMCLLRAELNWHTVCCIVLKPCLFASKLTILDWMLMAAIQLEIMCNGVKLRPPPWPSFSFTYHLDAATSSKPWPTRHDRQDSLSVVLLCSSPQVSSSCILLRTFLVTAKCLVDNGLHEEHGHAHIANHDVMVVISTPHFSMPVGHSFDMKLMLKTNVPVSVNVLPTTRSDQLKRGGHQFHSNSLSHRFRISFWSTFCDAAGQQLQFCTPGSKLLLAVNMAGCVPEQVQRKCGGNCKWISAVWACSSVVRCLHMSVSVSADCLSSTSSEPEVLHYPWDPGGSMLLYRLGGKPSLKEGGMSAVIYAWAIECRMGLAWSPVETCWGTTKGSKAGPEEGGMKQIKQTIRLLTEC